MTRGGLCLLAKRLDRGGQFTRLDAKGADRVEIGPTEPAQLLSVTVR
jgi:hypothetical protein